MADSLPNTQRAWRIVARGVPRDVVKLVTDLPVPKELKAGHVLLKVEAAALNPAYKLMKLLPNFMAGRPLTAEFDIAGTIVDGNGAEWSAGDAVFGINMSGSGALAEYVSMPGDCLIRRPPNMTAVEASGIACCALTAYFSLFEVAKLKEGQTLFINGGSTAVGSFATQFAKARGIRVVVTASGRNEEYVKKMGADEFIDYTKGDVVEYLMKNPPATKFDAILEAVGVVEDSLYANSEAYLTPEGVFMSMGPLPSKLGEIPQLGKLIFHLVWPKWLGGIKRRWTLVFGDEAGRLLKLVEPLFAAGTAKPLVDSVYSFENALDAYDRLMTHRATGKVVVKVDPNVSE
ncbi:NAD(P)-binding protein [Artomyces pyxidatus]|uniref:NAD(P)-binding protein n=1 Tax=Artomyces pyxidatus TaxID=48021 RepID=A0ACB8T3Z7_9AGAM|nr:NAD(P)-binding protein [Artomyces pyxidatus]